MQKVAIFGGSFDPIHWGHLLLAETAVTQLTLDRLIWVPDRCPPHKLSTKRLNFQHRWEMLKLAISDNPVFELSPPDSNPSGYSYGIETLNKLQVLYSHSQWYWLLGQDAFATLPKWYRRQELIPALSWLVAPRPDSNSTHLESLCQQVVQELSNQSISIRWQVLLMPSVPISSSLIRKYCLEQRSIRYLVPEAVRNYILSQQLYQSG